MDVKAVKLIFIVVMAVGALIGVLFFVIGCVLNSAYKDYYETIGVISEIVEDLSGSSTGHETYVTYSVDGKTYTGKLDVTASTDAVGKEVKVFYHPSDPQKIHGDTKLISFIFQIIGGSVFVAEVIGAVIVLFIFGRKKQSAI